MTLPERPEGTPADDFALVSAPSGSADLYPALVGPGWSTLPAPVRRIHTLTTTHPARGVVTVRRGTHPLARLLGLLLALPAAGERVAAELRVTPLPHGQRWSRAFGGVPLVTDQAAHAGALLEFVGPFALAFHLSVDGAALAFAQAPTRLGRPGLLLPWPRALSPRITGRCTAEGPDAARVAVEIAGPVVGLLVSYEGLFRTGGAPAEPT